MPMRVDTPSWLSAIRADDKPVYLNSEGVIKTGKSLKGRLFGIAESLGIFKGYVTSYRKHEAMHNRDAYDATWRSVSNKYGSVTRSQTKAAMEDQGYSRVFSFVYVRRLRGHDPRDPHRAIVGRELRLILDTARGVDESLRREAEVEQPEYYTGQTVRSDAEIAAQKQRWAVWTGARQSDVGIATQSGEAMNIVVAPESPGNVDGVANSLQDMNVSVDEASTLESPVNDVGSKPVQVSKELDRAMVAGNKKLLRQTLGSETQLRKMAQELGYNPEAIASRRNYIQGKLAKRLEADPRAKSGKLTRNDIHDLARAVFDKALGKNTMVAGIRGAMLVASNKVKRAQAQAQALHETQRQPEQPGQTSSPSANESVTALPESATAVAPSPDSLQPVSLPKPQKYQGVDYFDRSDKAISRLGVAVRNHQATKQVVSDNTYLAASVPDGHRRNELNSVHRGYIKTTLLRHVAEHERTSPGTLLSAADLHRMMRPITARALQQQSDSKLRAKVLYKNVTKHLGRKDAAFSDALKKMRRDARNEAWSKAGLLSFVRDAAHKANVTIDIDNRVLMAIRPQVKEMAEAHVVEHRKAITKADLENIVQIVLRGYWIANRMGRAS